MYQIIKIYFLLKYMIINDIILFEFRLGKQLQRILVSEFFLFSEKKIQELRINQEFKWLKR